MEKARKDIKLLKPYFAEQFKGLRMDTNANILGINPAITRALSTAKFAINQYPAPNSDFLRKALAKKLKLSPDNIIAGNGSDEILDFIMRAYLEPNDALAIPTPTFVMYKIYGILNFAKVIEIPLTRTKKVWDLDVSAFLKAKPKITIIANPNNPTGNCFPENDILKIIENSKGIIVIDEAYAEYSGKSLLPYINKYSNLIITRTFSKAYALAGLRIGYGVAQQSIIEELLKVKPPYNLNAVSESLAIEALKSNAWLKKIVKITIEEREKLSKELEKLGFEVYPSVTNFVLAKAPINSEKLCAALRKKAILIKDFGMQKELENCVRITIGKREDNSRLIKSINVILRS
ncbi:MAG: histidinol-phosphate transaminase [Candidatus Thermoplasmatota archaeon]|nr:histidinol-phosphate transaminase [Candidatus Thermoplasmatota archaeon]